MRRIWGPVAASLVGIGLIATAFSTVTAQQPIPAQQPIQRQVIQPGQPIAGQPLPAGAQIAGQAGMMNGTRYTIVDTEGTNLLVVDNATNTLYYYTVDEGKEVGDDLKLRGTVDLNMVGQPTIKPVAVGGKSDKSSEKPLPEGDK